MRRSMRVIMMRIRIILLLACMISLGGCAATGADPQGNSYGPDSPALPFDPHPAQPGTFTNRTDHTMLSD